MRQGSHGFQTGCREHGGSPQNTANEIDVIFRRKDDIYQMVSMSLTYCKRAGFSRDSIWRTKDLFSK